MNHNNIWGTFQSGFRALHSTETATLLYLLYVSSLLTLVLPLSLPPRSAFSLHRVNWNWLCLKLVLGPDHLPLLPASSPWPGPGFLPNGPASFSVPPASKAWPHWSVLGDVSCLVGRPSSSVALPTAMALLMPDASPPPLLLLSFSFCFMDVWIMVHDYLLFIHFCHIH